MTRRFFSSWLLLTVSAASIFFAAGEARAQPRAAGSVTLFGLLGGDEKGAAGLADLYGELGIARLGIGLGVGVLTNPDGEHSRAFTPLAFSAAVVLGQPNATGLELRGRLGLWGGATDQGLRSGAWGSIGAWLRIGLGGRAALLIGADGWFFSSTGRAVYVAPGLGFSWSS